MATATGGKSDSFARTGAIAESRRARSRREGPDWMPLATGCFNFGTGSDKGKYKTEELAAAWLWATGGSKEEVTPYTTTTDPETVSTGGAVTTYKTGTRFYNGIINDSTDLITNESGDAIAQYTYEPFGRIVPEASDLDLDGDGKSYTGGFLYTGQEWELETDVYNFHARTYDAQTGRFMQNDPVFDYTPGRDSYDPYQYVHEDPVNFVDPDGKKVCAGHVVEAVVLMQCLKNIRHLCW